MGCPASVVKNGENVTLKTDHNYRICRLKEKYPENNKEARTKMLAKAKKSTDDPADIFYKTIRKMKHKQVDLSLSNVQQSIKRLRRKNRPITPTSLEDLGKVLLDYDEVEKIYIGPATGDDGSTALLFSSEKLMLQLDKQKEIFMDGTFDGVGTVFALCNRRTTSTYDAIFKKLKECCPNLEKNIKTVMGDFEKATINSVKANFRNSQYRGCWFHYKKAARKQWKKKGLKNGPLDFLEMILAIPLLPPDKIANAVTLLESKIMEYDVKYQEKLRKYIRYMRRYWVKIADILSVTSLEQRTNNICESFNSRMVKRFDGLHPNIWKFLDRLKIILMDEEIRLHRLLRGDVVSGSIKKIDKIRNNKIRIEEEKFKERRSIELFLKNCAEIFSDLRKSYKRKA